MLPYLALVAWWTHSHGIAGTAAAWTLRVLVDTLLMQALAQRVHAPLAALVRTDLAWLAAGLAAFAACATLDSPGARWAVLAAATAHGAWLLWPYARRVLPKGAGR